MDFIPLMIPDIQPHDKQAVLDVLDSGMLIQGKKVAELEEKFCNFLGVRNAVAVSNGTATMHLVLKAWNIGPGDEVIVPALSYVATANVVELVGATPIFVDVEQDAFNIDAAKIEEKITSKTKAILPVHEFGLCCDMPAIMDIAERNNLLVLEDAACALGATSNEQFTGTFGHAASFSLHPRKAITSGEGGVIVTNDDELASKLRVIRNHGIEMQQGEMVFVEVGFNYRLTDIQAALVSSQFDRIDKILTYKRQLAQVYLEKLDHKNIVLPIVPETFKHTWQSFHVLLIANEDRKQLIAQMREKGIGVNYGAQCIPHMDYYQKKYGESVSELYPNALRAYEKGLVLPLYEKLNAEQVEYVANALNSLLLEK